MARAQDGERAAIAIATLKLLKGREAVKTDESASRKVESWVLMGTSQRQVCRSYNPTTQVPVIEGTSC